MTANEQTKSTSNSATLQRPTGPVFVNDVTMLSPLGDDVMLVTAAVRADINCFGETSFYNQKLSPLKMALVPEEALPPLDDELAKKGGITTRQQRLLRLATRPLTTLFEKCTESEPLPLFLAGPEKLPGRRSIISDNFLKLLKAQSKQSIDIDNSYVFPFGRTAGLYALEAAMIYIENHPGRQVIVGGVDSYIDLHLIATLTRDHRITATGVMDGFIPGESAAFLLIGDASTAQAGKPRFALHPPGISQEPGHRYSTEPYRGEGLAKALTEALDIDLSDKISTTMISFNGENFFAKEWSVAAVRNSIAFIEAPNLLHPADCFGDVGAAFGPIAIGIAVIGMHKKYLTSPALICCSSEMEQRAAVCLTVV